MSMTRNPGFAVVLGLVSGPHGFFGLTSPSSLWLLLVVAAVDHPFSLIEDVGIRRTALFTESLFSYHCFAQCV
jgi:hypothetical protein